MLRDDNKDGVYCWYIYKAKKVYINDRIIIIIIQWMMLKKENRRQKISRGWRGPKDLLWQPSRANHCCLV